MIFYVQELMYFSYPMLSFWEETIATNVYDYQQKLTFIPHDENTHTRPITILHMKNILGLFKQI